MLRGDGSDTAEFEVTSDGTFPEDLVIELTASGSASPEEYLLSETEVTLGAGATSVVFTLTAAHDAIQEGTRPSQ